ncbi:MULTISPECIES: helix-turn-helix domain-containing protein [unclassified Acidovorax]|uniref:helix-turn-helix domain-containing protein n=1 Tax=unclassified Acidovorax TaxID=2684926 RepID=UPI0009E685EA
MTQKSFGALIYELRLRLDVSQRWLALRVRQPHSIICDLENSRRLPPSEEAVRAIAQALEATPADAEELLEAAFRERAAIGLKVARATPRHVAELLREIAALSHQLSQTQTRSLSQHLQEVSMK